MGDAATVCTDRNSEGSSVRSLITSSGFDSGLLDSDESSLFCAGFHLKKKAPARSNDAKDHNWNSEYDTWAMLSGFYQKNTTCTHHCHQPHIKKKGAPRKIQRFQNQVSLGRIQTFLRFCALIPRRAENHQAIPNPSCLFIASGQDPCRDRVTGLKISAISYDGHCSSSKLALFLIMSVPCLIRRIKFSPRPGHPTS